MKLIWQMIRLFCAVTTAQVFFIALLSFITEDAVSFTPFAFWRVLAIALASTLPTLIFLRSENISRMGYIVRSALHFILTAGAVFGLLVFFGWVDATNAIIISILFLVIYIGAFIFQDRRERKLANSLNERIKAFHKGENATHDDRH